MIAQVHGEGTPLIVIHGFGVDHRILLPLEDMLQGRAWKRIYLDLPWAQGAEDTGEQTPHELAGAVLAEVQEIVGEGDFAVVGNSFGAIIARHIAHTLRSQCLGLATLAGVFQADHALRRLPEHRVTLHDAEVLERAGDAREEFAEIAVVHTSQTLERFQRFVLPGLRGASQKVLERLGARYTQAPAPEADTEEPFEAPSLHVFGRQDQVVGFEGGLALRDHYTRGSFVVLDAAGHNVHLEQPEVVGALLRDWLDRADTAHQVASAQLLGVE